MSTHSKEMNVVWQAIANSSQEFALDTRCHHTLYHGTRGPGKTIAQLMRFRRRVGLGYGAFWRGVIFDQEHKNLDDLVAQSNRYFPSFLDGVKFISSASGYKWVWPSGEQLLFRHIKDVKEYQKFHGHEYPFIGFNELTKYPTPDVYDAMCSTNRSSFIPEIHTPKDKDGNYQTSDGKPLPPIPLEVFSTTNPSGPGHNWVKDRFIDCARNGEVVKQEVEVYHPAKKQNVKIEITQVAIFGSYKENIYLDPKYIADLNRATESNENLRKAWLEGSWEFTAGGALDDLWKKAIHVVPRFKIPKEWYVDRSFDWGSTTPFSVGWWAESNGEEAKFPGGEVFCPPAGSLVRIGEWYGTEKIGTNKGLKLSARAIVNGIIEREIELMESGWIEKQPFSGPADNQIGTTYEIDNDTIKSKMEDLGVCWTKSDKSPGSRIIGLQLIRDRLESAIKGEGPGIYFMQNCQAAIKTLPTLPRDDKNTEDVLKGSEDHIYDETRYRVLKDNKRAARKIDFKFSI